MEPPTSPRNDGVFPTVAELCNVDECGFYPCANATITESISTTSEALHDSQNDYDDFYNVFYSLYDDLELDKNIDYEFASPLSIPMQFPAAARDLQMLPVGLGLAGGQGHTYSYPSRCAQAQAVVLPVASVTATATSEESAQVMIASAGAVVTSSTTVTATATEVEMEIAQTEAVSQEELEYLFKQDADFAEWCEVGTVDDVLSQQGNDQYNNFDMTNAFIFDATPRIYGSTFEQSQSHNLFETRFSPIYAAPSTVNYAYCNSYGTDTLHSIASIAVCQSLPSGGTVSGDTNDIDRQLPWADATSIKANSSFTTLPVFTTPTHDTNNAYPIKNANVFSDAANCPQFNRLNRPWDQLKGDDRLMTHFSEVEIPSCTNNRVEQQFDRFSTIDTQIDLIGRVERPADLRNGVDSPLGQLNGVDKQFEHLNGVDATLRQFNVVDKQFDKFNLANKPLDSSIKQNREKAIVRWLNKRRHNKVKKQFSAILQIHVQNAPIASIGQDDRSTASASTSTIMKPRKKSVFTAISPASSFRSSTTSCHSNDITKSDTSSTTVVTANFNPARRQAAASRERERGTGRFKRAKSTWVSLPDFDFSAAAARLENSTQQNS